MNLNATVGITQNKEICVHHSGKIIAFIVFIAIYNLSEITIQFTASVRRPSKNKFLTSYQSLQNNHCFYYLHKHLQLS